MSVTIKEGPRYAFDDLIFYALGGCICIEDNRDGSANFVVPDEFRQRAVQLNREAKRMYTMPDPWRRRMADRHAALTRAIGCMADCYRDAKDQGDPTDPNVLKQLRRERKQAALIL